MVNVPKCFNAKQHFRFLYGLPYLSIRPLKQFGSCNQHLVKDNLAEEINGR
jgi:hypothetical protein